jgi:uncharacterized protein
MGTINFENAKQYALQRLERELSPKLVYHGIAHTRDDVVPAAGELAEQEGVRADLRPLLITAAWFHDLGFIESVSSHESIGARLASEVLPGFGYSAQQVDMVKGIIMATVLPQAPNNHLEQIMADADLDVLGRDDFFVCNQKLRVELAFLGQEFMDFEWYLRQLQFLESHSYFTASARAHRDVGKLKNIHMLRKWLEVVEDKSK